MKQYFIVFRTAKGGLRFRVIELRSKVEAIEYMYLAYPGCAIQSVREQEPQPTIVEQR